MKITINQFITQNGINPFERWFNKLNAMAAAKITTALYRLEIGNFSQVKSVGQGIFEYKIDFGPGYRIYFGQENEKLVILVGGGSKKQQDKDIKLAKLHWQSYQQSKKLRVAK